MKIFRNVLLALLLVSSIIFAQKKPLGIAEFDSWNRIESEKISSDGNIIVYHLSPGKGDASIYVHSKEGEELLHHARASSSSISWDSRWVSFMIQPSEDSIREMKRAKLVQEDDFPKDTLAVFDVDGNIMKYAPVVDYKMPKEWSGALAYRLDYFEIPEDTTKSDADTTKVEKPKKPKKVSKKNGFHLVVLDLESGYQDTIKYVTGYQFAEKGPELVIESKGADSTFKAGIYYYHPETKELTALKTGEHAYKEYTLSQDGKQAAFLLDRDTTKALIRNYELAYWKQGMDSASIAGDSSAVDAGWLISEYSNLYFSDNGEKLYLGIAPLPIVEDTTLLEDEKIQVEIWSYTDGRLMTQQEIEKKDDRKKTYLAIYNPANGSFSTPVDEKISSVRMEKTRNSALALGVNDVPYLQSISWEGFPQKADLYQIDFEKESYKPIAKGIRAYYQNISPDSKYFYWYNMVDSAWFTYSITSGEIKNISEFIPESIFDEEDDHPDYPSPYGMAGWTKGDKEILVYDRYDIWAVNPEKPESARKLTDGRQDRNRYRIRTLDPDERFVSLSEAYMEVFNEKTKEEGFALMKGSKINMLITGSFRYSVLEKARKADQVMFTKQSNEVFPDILVSNLKFENPVKLSEANPQQADYLWSSVELISWTSLDGIELEGLLYKPENFDPAKKYPLMTYFYEKNSDNLHRYWGAFPIRSIINPSYYASRGYVVFIPNIVYKDGYPGQSCYNAVIPGVTKLIETGYIDKDRIGTQGHSWGGYQTAYLVTRTDIFACAESGAPVSNMISAYGGIRWWTGLSRMFQYEHTQSRIGGTLWEYPMRYIENSPIFYIDKINTPLLIMHNDEDGHVPWYQGIEFFVALRRLNKPAWMLNYNGEPHWPVKRENIIDFNIRMQQFFDHYLMDKPAPKWMEEGIPAVLKGIEKGYVNSGE